MDSNQMNVPGRPEHTQEAHSIPYSEISAFIEHSVELANKTKTCAILCHHHALNLRGIYNGDGCVAKNKLLSGLKLLTDQSVFDKAWRW